MSGKLVKCLICGAVFDASLEVCPVCGVGKEFFVPYEEEKSAFSRNTDKRFLILGGGTAAVSAAEAIRVRDKTCKVTMLSNEGVLPINRPMLTKDMLAGLTRDAFAIHGRDWYDENRIELFLDKTVASVDAEARRVTCADGSTFSYDECVYALGAKSFVPPFPGADRDGVFTIRTLNDIEAIVERLPQTERAVVIGGGVLGLEAAWELKKSGLDVSVLEGSERLLRRQLDEAGSALLRKIAEKNGVKIVTNAATEEIEGGGAVTGVRLVGGTALPGQLVVISTGVRANAAVAQSAGAAVGRAVIVDEHMRTNVPNLFACGDCAEHLGVNFSIWPEATEMGKVAGANAAGEPLAYKNPLPGLTLTTFETELYAIGDAGTDPNKQYERVSATDEAANRQKTLYFADGRLCGVILIGDLSEMDGLTQAVLERREKDKLSV